MTMKGSSASKRLAGPNFDSFTSATRPQGSTRKVERDTPTYFDNCSRSCGLLLSRLAESNRSVSPEGVTVSMRSAARECCKVATPLASTETTCQRLTRFVFVFVSARVPARTSTACVCCSTRYVSTCPACQRNRQAAVCAGAACTQHSASNAGTNALKLMANPSREMSDEWCGVIPRQEANARSLPRGACLDLVQKGTNRVEALVREAGRLMGEALHCEVTLRRGRCGEEPFSVSGRDLPVARAVRDEDRASATPDLAQVVEAIAHQPVCRHDGKQVPCD